MRQSYLHRGGDEPLIGVTIADHFHAVCNRFPEREAVVSMPQNRRLTYSELRFQVDLLAWGLLETGIERGDRIGIWATNNIEWLLLQLATARIGAVLVNINPAYRPKELAYAIERSELKALFTIPAFRKSDYIAMLVELIPELAHMAPGELTSSRFPTLKRVVVYEPDDPDHSERFYPGLTTWQEVLPETDEVDLEQLDHLSASLDIDDAINIQYTSGTTGFPKAVVLSHHNILNNAWFSAKAMHFSEHDRLAIPVPFYHCFGMVLANLLCLSVGACAVIPCEHFDAGLMLRRSMRSAAPPCTAYRPCLSPSWSTPTSAGMT